MIVVDASAIVAILLGEPEAVEFAARLHVEQDGHAMSAVNYWEMLAKAEVSRGEIGRREAEHLLRALRIEIHPADAEQVRLAIEAFVRFGRHTPAKLNLGDCFAYALAVTHGGGALLYKGDDFARTDLRSAVKEA
ncbi:type II toxin-antitoxin system VapC family toxin [Caulobacter endophyticus]|uniref:type II toxin-antitoxin system VapC family toxin n=1 Tax=Caulobacter endophyticus TaxID=2172652 RepID=UPI0024105EEC|nr:type II toxin-antitoxin system VapC family toxin [Caulobacter endophyticus]MDG2527672.1 type II toxin-antitoxin system VapC family toxin [Caulobacter endophyticus]